MKRGAAVSPLLVQNEIVSMTAETARKLIAAGDGDCALLYLTLLNGGEMDGAKRELHWEDARLNSAYSRLADLGLVARENRPAPRREEDLTGHLPEYSRQDITRALSDEPEFKGLYEDVERIWGFSLSDADLKGLYLVYDGLAMPREVVLLMAQFVLHQVQRHKTNARPRMVQLKQEAFRWKRLGLTTVETAEEYLKKQESVDAREWDILSAVGIRDRRPAVERERQYINSWTDMNISDELIAMAYERTVFKKGAMNWAYMNQILQSWHRSGWRTAEEVRANDKPPKRAGRTGTTPQETYQPSAEQIRKDQEWLDRVFEERKRKG